jgi:hypothetical protein
MHINTAKKTLGAWTTPTGDPSGSLERMKNSAMQWIIGATTCKLSHHALWFSFKRHFWSSISYGLCSNTASLAALDEVVQKGILPACFTKDWLVLPSTS